MNKAQPLTMCKNNSQESAYLGGFSRFKIVTV